jgi:hypothetical protein
MAGISQYRESNRRKFCTAHNLKVVGSNPTPATKNKPAIPTGRRAFACPNQSINPPFGATLGTKRQTKRGKVDWI